MAGEQLGTIYLKPSEMEYSESLREKTKVDVRSIEDIKKKDIVKRGDIKRELRELDSKSFNRLDVTLPDIKDIRQVETYDPRSEMYTSTSQTGSRGTAYMRPPTPDEQRRIEEVQKKGSILEIGKTVIKKTGEIGTRVLEPVTEFRVQEKEYEVPVLGKVTFFKGAGEDTLTVGQTFGGIFGEVPSEIVSVGSEKISEKVYDTGLLSYKYETKLTGKISEEKQKEIELRRKEGLKTTLGFVGQVGKYATPAGWVLPLAGETVSGMERVKHPERYFEYKPEYYSEYLKEMETEGIEEGYRVLTEDEFKPLVEEQGITNLREQGLIQAGTGLLILGGFGALKGYKAVTIPKEIKGSRVGGESFRLGYTEKQWAKLTEKGGMDVYSKFKLMDVRTPQTTYTQSLFGKLIGREPKLVVLSRGQTYITQPLANIFGLPTKVDKPYLAVSGRVGVKGDLVNLKLYKIGGKETELLKEGISQLPKTEQYLWKSLVEKTKTGVPIKYSDISKYVSEEDLLSRGIIKQIDFSKIGTGRTTTLSQTGTITRPIKEFELGAGTFKIQTGFKDITKPLSRAVGKIPTQEGVLIRYPVITPETDTGVKVFLGGGKKSSKQFLEQLYKLEKPVPITKPVIKIPSPTIKPEVIIKDTTRGLPSMVGGTGLVTSEYWGTGQYEVTEGSSQTFLPSVISESRVDVGFKIIPLVDVTQKYDVGLKTDVMLKTDVLTKSILKEQTKVQQKEIQALKPLQTLKTQQLLKTQQVTKQILKQTTKTQQKQKPKPPKPKVPIKPIITIGIPSKPKPKKKIEEDGFEIYRKTKGKPELIGIETEESRAFKKLKKGLKETLSASGWVEKAGKKIDVGGWVGGEFRKAKRSEVILVQKRGLRLGTIREVFQIQKARKKIKRRWM